MKSHYLIVLTVAVPGAFMSSCVDNNYDLSDIDTTTEIAIDNLTLPVRLDPVELSSFIKINEGDKIREVTINGDTFYAVEETGDYSSDPIHINRFEVEPAPLTPTIAVFELVNTPLRAKKAARQSVNYQLTNPVNRNVTYSGEEIDESIHKVTWMSFSPMHLRINLALKDTDPTIPGEISNIVIELPEGLAVSGVEAPGYNFNISDYTASTGQLRLSSIKLVSGLSYVDIIAEAIDLNPATYPGYSDLLNYNTHRFNLHTRFNLKSGRLILSPEESQIASMGNSMEMDIDYYLNSADVTSMLGDVSYDLTGEGLNFDPIKIEDLPDFLADENTNLVLSNPQIYLNIDNPVGNEGLMYQSGLMIKSLRKGQIDGSFPLNSFTVPSAQGYGPYNFLLAPQPDAVSLVPEEYKSGLNRVVYPNLGNILSGAGIPDMLDLSLVNPNIPLQTLKSPLALGRDIPGLTGTYRFLAPLALEGDDRTGSVIYYRDINDGWGNEDVEALVINKMAVTAIASSTLPLGAELSVYPIDNEGHRIPNVNITPAVVPAKGDNVEILCLLEGEIRNLDGLEYVAEVRPDGNPETLKPDQSITLNNLKATVTGTYTKKL